MQAALTAIEDERHHGVFRTIGRAYAVLESDLPAGHALIRQAAAASAVTSSCAMITESFGARERAFANRAIAGAVQKSKDLIRSRDKDTAERLLQTVSRAIPFASSEVRMDWERAQKKVTATTLISRLRG